jgi:hypothetical protein
LIIIDLWKWGESADIEEDFTIRKEDIDIEGKTQWKQNKNYGKLTTESVISNSKTENALLSLIIKTRIIEKYEQPELYKVYPFTNPVAVKC